MKMLTLHQPWASLIAIGAKSIETRGWSTAVRGPLAIHAGASIPSYLGLGRRGRIEIGGYEMEKDGPGQALLRGPGLPWPYRLPFGAVVAVADLVDVVPIGVPRPGTYVADLPDDGELPHQQGGLWLIGPNQLTTGTPTRVEDQAPFGDFTPGRFAWLLDNVRAVEPVPAKGHQGLRDIDPNIGAMVEAAIR